MCKWRFTINWLLVFSKPTAMINGTPRALSSGYLHSSSIGRSLYKSAFGKQLSSVAMRLVSLSMEADCFDETYSKIMEFVKGGIPKA